MIDQREQVSTYLKQLQDSICAEFEAIDSAQFVEDEWQHTNGTGGGRTRVLCGDVIEKGGVNFSHIKGDQLPTAATLKRPELAGKKFEAMGVSLVMHPNNPFAPTSHMNVRFFIAGADTQEPVWWFGGGFDMTPYYGFEEDAKHWHQVAADACAESDRKSGKKSDKKTDKSSDDELGCERYSQYKKWCDDYFHLPHRNEQRGIGGLFFDDLNELGFEQSFAFMQSVGSSFVPAYLPILKRRKDQPFNQAQRDWQLLRRGRYVEFNLVHDRGTLFGLQSGGRTESILMSMPPLVAWQYRAEPEEGSPEHDLLENFLQPKDWLA